jgi:hypothetical protein
LKFDFQRYRAENVFGSLISGDTVENVFGSLRICNNKKKQQKNNKNSSLLKGTTNMQKLTI